MFKGSKRTNATGGGDGAGGNDGDNSIFRLAPYHYLHVLNQTSNITRVVVGPQTFIRQDNETVVLKPTRMITIPARHFCAISNPIQCDEDGNVQYEGDTEQVMLRHGEVEIRTAREPFPLYPGELLLHAVSPLKVVPADCALRLRCLRDFDDKVAGDEWLFIGPGTYTPRVEEEAIAEIKAIVVAPNQALLLEATRETTNSQGKKCVTGEQWMMKEVGAYIPGAYEKVVRLVSSIVLTDKKALQVRALRSYTDQFGNDRKVGEEWLVKSTDTESFIPDVCEEVVSEVQITTLDNRQYAVVLDPVDENGVQMLGSLKLVKGPISFFLQPGETLRDGVQSIYVLSELEGLVLRATNAFHDDLEDKDRKPGDRWMLRGPLEYVPPVEVEVVQMRRAMPLDANEGIYVRNTKTGEVRAEIGKTYMLNENEELYEKVLPPHVEELLAAQDEQTPSGTKSRAKSSSSGEGAKGTRVKTSVVRYRVPHNAAVQIYDFQKKTARVVFGPELVLLQPDEHFTVLSLSGDTPKRPHQIKTLCLRLGPDFCTDVIQIETADHARLQLQLSYNWHFKVDKTDQEQARKIFSVPDFVGDLCKAAASCIRAAVATTLFDDFHKNSAHIIRSSVFGLDPATNKVKDEFTFPENCLCITNIDIQSAEPVDQRTRDSLQKSVQLAIEITTSSQEATARHEAQRREQQAKGSLERQKIKDEAEAEHSKKKLLELQALSAAVESSGQAKAEAQSRAEAARIEGEAAVEQARLKAEALKIESESALVRLEEARKAELDFIAKRDKIEIEKEKQMVALEVSQYQAMISAIGPQTLVAMAEAGPDSQVKLLQSLGLQSTIITDGKTPLNLLNTAAGLVGGATSATPSSFSSV
eukprot:m.11789 g.11789  ORF g.11789 m.11789 type:complete len:870 (+) comp5769_c0_seq1:425-3034(+)